MTYRLKRHIHKRVEILSQRVILPISVHAFVGIWRHSGDEFIDTLTVIGKLP